MDIDEHIFMICCGNARKQAARAIERRTTQSAKGATATMRKHTPGWQLLDSKQWSGVDPQNPNTLQRSQSKPRQSQAKATMPKVLRMFKETNCRAVNKTPPSPM